MTDALLTVKDVAARLAVGRTTAYELLRRKVIPSVVIPTTTIRRVRASDLDDFCRQHGAGCEEAAGD